MTQLPDTPVGRRAAWLMDTTAQEEATVDEVRGLFADAFLERVTADRIVQAVLHYRVMASAGIESVEERSPYELSLVTGPDGEACVDVRVDTQDPHRLTGLRTRPSWTRHEVLASTPPSAEPLPDLAARYVGPLAGRLSAGGLVVGIICGDHEWAGAFGPVVLDAAFEIGSVTKAFTGIVLAEMAGRREVGLDEPVRLRLPEGAVVPDETITLLHLATHTSGLPRSLRPFLDRRVDPSNSFSGLTVEELYEALSRTGLQRRPGAGYEYSNYGYILLGHALSLATGRPYRELLAERVCRPLGLAETMVAPGSDLESRRAVGHSRSGKPMPPWDGELAAPAGGIESTLADMLAFVRANLAPSMTTLGEPLIAAQGERVRRDEHASVGLGWSLVLAPDGSNAIWHNGGTSGFRSFVGFHGPSRSGVVVLCNEVCSHDREAMQLLAAIAGIGKEE